MHRLNWKIKTTALSLAVFAGGSPCMADEGTGQLTQQTEQITAGFISLIKKAFSGGAESTAAVKSLLSEYAAPTFMALAIVWFSFIVASAIGRYIGGMVEQKVDVTLGKFLTKAIRNALVLLGVMGVLSYFKIDITGLAALVAAIGFAVGMALQGTLGNFASGVMLLLFRPFKVNDYIVASDTQGTVEEIDLFTTRINTPDNRHVIVPNGQLFGSKLENYTRNELRRVDVAVGCAYDADLDQTRQALERAVMSVTEAVVSPPPQVYLEKLGASSVDWSLRVWCSPEAFFVAKEQLTAAAKRQLDMAGIGIPYPQMDIHVVPADGQSATKAA